MEDRESDLLSTHAPFSLGDVRIDPGSLCMERAGSTQRVEAKVMELLLALVREPGRVFSRRELEDVVWSGRIVTDDALTNAIGKLRRALDDNPRHPRLIETIPKRGYRLIVEPELATADASVPTVPWVGVTLGKSRRGWWILAAALVIAVLAAVVLWRSKAPEVVTEPELPTDSSASVAVIPFDVLDADASQSYFAEGISLDLITELSRIPGLLVIAPGTVFSYRETAADDRTIATELGVRYLIRGGVQRIGEQIRINVRLLESGRGTTLWAERFAGKAGSLFRIQDEVVEGIAEALSLTLELPRQPPERSGATQSIAAYDEFLRGRERYGRLTPEDNRIARAHFERAIALDPGFARAYAGLALAWSRLAIDGWTDDPQSALSRAEEYAERAASIDPSVPQIHFARAQVELFRGRHKKAADSAAAATALDPNYADAYALLAWILNYAGRPDQAEPMLAEALKRNPRSSASYREIAGEIDFSTGLYGEAEEEFQAALERNPTNTRARLWLAATYSKLGNEEAAAWEVQELLALNPEFALSRLLLAFPLKDPKQRDALTDVLEGLGLPE